MVPVDLVKTDLQEKKVGANSCLYMSDKNTCDFFPSGDRGFPGMPGVCLPVSFIFC